MTNPTIRIHDQETGETVDREMTESEVAALDETFEQISTQQAAREEAKATAEAKLFALGLTIDDLKAIGL